MQGLQSPESGVATNKERLLPRRRVSESARGVLGCTPQHRRTRETQQIGVFQQSSVKGGYSCDLLAEDQRMNALRPLQCAHSLKIAEMADDMVIS
jgi:hypothetical protein